MMSGNVRPDLTHLSSASSYSGICHLPMPAGPMSRTKAVCFGDFLRQLRGPRSAGAQVRGREEQARRGVLALDRGLQPLRQRLIRRVVAQEPALHSMHRVAEPHAGPPPNATGLLIQDIELSGTGQRECVSWVAKYFRRSSNWSDAPEEGSSADVV